jgi:hypothetical protein
MPAERTMELVRAYASQNPERSHEFADRIIGVSTQRQGRSGLGLEA